MSSVNPTSSEHTDLTWEVRANDHQYHKKLLRKSILCFRKGKYADNVVRSFKYTALTFVPLSLYEQFHRMANLFFLLMVILQSIPAISTLQWYITMMPLLTVLSVRGFKDLADDLARRRSDAQINRRSCDILTSEGFCASQWQDVHVGDILRLHVDQIIPADLLLLYSSEPHSLCYVETADIDGETNLKFRQALTITDQELTEPIERSLLDFNGRVVCEEPNSNLYSFRGELHWRGERHPLDTDHILLRGTVLRNTETAYGVVIYAGADTKILRNCGRLIVKKTRVEMMLNKVVIGIVLFVLQSALLLAVGTGVFESSVAPRIEPLAALAGGTDPVYRAFLTYWGYIILLAPAMPMSLYVSFEMIHVIHSLLIGWDLELYDQSSNTRAHARSTALNEELGQVGYLLSDKTGTLTQNRLLFRQCCIAGVLYGAMPDNEKKPEKLDLSWNAYSRGTLQFYDQRLVERLRGRACTETRDFFCALALCHTVMSEWKEGTLRYQAASPDEEALVGAARELGWVFLSRTRESMTVCELGEVREYQLLTLIDFTSQRRRMSVLVREPGGALKLYCKGADIVILERLKQGSPHQESHETALELYAQGCLRTLCVATRVVSEELWKEWSRVLTEAAMAMRHDDNTLEKLYEDMECELTLLGVTAIEDRLQDGVPQTISTLRQAGVKVWVLTGDKTETAVNIGYSCSLLDTDAVLLQGEELRQLLEAPDPQIALNKGNEIDCWGKYVMGAGSTVAMVTTGPELAEMQERPELGERFVSLSQLCQSVLCCRMTPGQKAGVVELVRKHTSAITLAIGDGANDVNMIKRAHIGVGLSGVEGSQAVQNADYSLAQFRFLRKLLLVHGRWSYRRLSTFLRYFLYKTTTFAFVHAWYGFFNGFSAERIYENWFVTLYTTMYTIMPILSLGILEQDMSAEASIRWPEVYGTGQRQELFNAWKLAGTLLYSLYTSLVVFFVPVGVASFSPLDYQSLAIIVETGVVFTVTGEAILQIKFWTKYNVGAVVLSLLLFFVSTLMLHTPRLHAASPLDYYFPGVSFNAFRNPLLWLTALLTTCTAILPSMTAQALVVVLAPSNTHRVHSIGRTTSPQGHDEMQLRFRRGDSKRRSSYAMSQGKGFGRLVTSGLSGRSTAPSQDGRETAEKTDANVPQRTNGGNGVAVVPKTSQ